LNDEEPPFTFTGNRNKVTLSIDRPKLTPEDIQKLEEARKAAATKE
jgi:arylsulfatase